MANVVNCLILFHKKTERAKKLSLLFIFFVFCSFPGLAEKPEAAIKVGAEQIEKYFPLIKNRPIAIVSNHTSLLGKVHLVDSLLSLGIKVKKVLSPEHGFRGKADAGELVSGSKDAKTGLPIVSLYGKHKKPTAEDLDGIEMVVFDLQDVGVRFYTYISTMHYVMEACAENKIPFLVLDRPNPNGHYVDGPILEPRFKSFVGLHPVPIVHGMTVGEYAQMINGEGWLSANKKCDLKVIKVKGYDHSSFYELPVKPSPNLPTMSSVYLYPSLCLFEGTIVSIGRGTDFPFQIYGHPKMYNGDYTFTPRSIPGASKYPKHEGKECYGVNLTQYGRSLKGKEGRLNLSWILKSYEEFPEDLKKDFFINYFNNLAGTSILKQQIKDGKSEKEIRKTWAFGIDNFKKNTRKVPALQGF